MKDLRYTVVGFDAEGSNGDAVFTLESTHAEDDTTEPTRLTITMPASLIRGGVPQVVPGKTSEL